MWRPWLGSGLVVIAITCAPGPVLAQSPAPASQEAAAKASFDAGQQLYDRRRYSEALALFRSAEKASGSPNASLMIARCLLEMGALAEAYEALTATMKRAAALARDNPKYARTRDAAATALGTLERRIGRLVIVANGLPEGASVTLNGAAVPPERLGVAFVVTPGNEIVEVVAPGATQRREVKVGAGESKTVTFGASTTAPGSSATAEPPSTAVAGSPSSEGSPPAAGTGGGVRVAGFVVAGVGVAGLVLAAVAAPVAQGKFDMLEQACGDARCPDSRYADVIAVGKTMDALTVVGLAVGAAGVLSGGLMIGLGGPRSAPARAAVTVSQTGAQLHYRFDF